MQLHPTAVIPYPHKISNSPHCFTLDCESHKTSSISLLVWHHDLPAHNKEHQQQQKLDSMEKVPGIPQCYTWVAWLIWFGSAS